jgi:hypothetical protein
MKTVYSNTRHPKLIKWSCIVVGIISVACMVLYAVLKGETYLFTAAYTLAYSAGMFAVYKLSTYIFDDEADTITFSQQKKYPLRLSDITTITYNESKKGRFRYLLIHDSGVGFMQIRTTRENADKMTEQILAANPAAEVKHANYL